MAIFDSVKGFSPFDSFSRLVIDLKVNHFILHFKEKNSREKEQAEDKEPKGKFFYDHAFPKAT